MLAAATEGATWLEVWGKPGSEVWRATGGRAGAGRYLKVTTTGDQGGAGGGGEDLREERERLVWLSALGPAARVATPALAAAGRSADGRDWLLTEDVPGTPAHDPALLSDGGRRLAETLGRGLRAWHDALPAGDCPFDASLDRLLASAERRVAAGGVDPDGFEPQYRHLTPAQVLAWATAHRPPEPGEDRVVAHGDPCTPNLLVDQEAGTLAGIVDLGRLGLSDRYRDLGILVRSFAANCGPQEVWKLLDAYGIDRPDPVRLDYYVLLDELW